MEPLALLWLVVLVLIIIIRSRPLGDEQRAEVWLHGQMLHSKMPRFLWRLMSQPQPFFSGHIIGSFRSPC